MTTLSTALSGDRILIDCQMNSKKRTIELLSKLLTDDDSILEFQDILSGLLAREKLGSTFIGHSIALPHARFPDIEKPKAAIIRMHEAINYDDENHVQFIFGLIVPDDDSDVHLKLLAEAAEKLGQENIRNAIMLATHPDAIYRELTS